MADGGMQRISKLLAAKGLCSRREADEYIKRGWVLLDGRPVTELGTKALPTQDIRLAKSAERVQSKSVTILLHKPPGYVSGQPEGNYKSARDLISAQTQERGDNEPGFTPHMLAGLAPAGRLDISARGLQVYTQDGRVARQLIGEGNVEREYIIRIEGEISRAKLDRLKGGIALDGKMVKPSSVMQINPNQFTMVISGTGHRHLWRMVEAVALKPIAMKRVRIGNVRLGGLDPGKWRLLRPNEKF